MSLRRVHLCLFAVLVVAGCAHRAELARDTEPGTFETVLVRETDQGSSYLLDTGDRVRIFVYGQPNLSRIYSIDGTGNISMPLIGAVNVRHKTSKSLERIVAARLQIRYVKDPHVSVEIATYRPFFVLGEVRNAGQFPYVEGMTARTAVAIAGGYAPRANEGKVQITRVLNDQRETFIAGADEPLRPGDTVYVRERWL